MSFFVLVKRLVVVVTVERRQIVPQTLADPSIIQTNAVTLMTVRTLIIQRVVRVMETPTFFALTSILVHPLQNLRVYLNDLNDLPIQLLPIRCSDGIHDGTSIMAIRIAIKSHKDGTTIGGARVAEKIELGTPRDLSLFKTKRYIRVT